MKRLILYIIYVQLGLGLVAQCGTDEDPRMREIIKSMPANYNRSLIEIPITFHVVQLSNGFGGIDSSIIMEELEKVNEVYLIAGIRFYKCQNINYIANSNYTTFLKTTSEDLSDLHDRNGTLNIYFVPDLIKVSNGDTISLCGYAHMFNKDRVFMDNDCSDNGSTVLHEIGHYMSLYHTHSTANGQEYVNGSNCMFAGDGFCDTPADPKLSSSDVNSICIYTANDTDPNGDVYQPDVNNLMAYGRKSCREHFSQEQMDQMNYYTTNNHQHLSCFPASLSSDKSEYIKVIRSGQDVLLSLPYSASKVEALVFDLLGRLMKRVDVASGDTDFKLESLAPHLIILWEDGKIIYKNKL